MASDEPIFERINALSHEEERLWERAGHGDGLDASENARLEQIKIELDQCYDLLHQRAAKRSAGLDPDDAAARSADVVERYQQ